MATYKLIQDIEAEDHILGPLSLRQFIFALIAAFCGYLSFISVAKHVPVLLVLFLPPTLFCGFFAFPWGRDQPTETWALAKLRFWFKPRRRVWNQSGIKELVTITVPKKVERVLTDNLSQTEVKSRLQALANTIDSRGWAIKHINAVGYVPQVTSSDRLIDIPVVPPQETPADLAPADDIMDADHSPVAQQFQTMIDKSTEDYRQRLVSQLQEPVAAAQPSPQWFMNQGSSQDTPAPVSYTEDAALSAQLKQQRSAPQEYGNLRTLQPLASATPPADNTTLAAPAGPQAPDDASTAMTASGDPAILSLSKNNDLNVATLAREAERAKRTNEPQDEVVISLH